MCRGELYDTYMYAHVCVVLVCDTRVDINFVHYFILRRS